MRATKRHNEGDNPQWTQIPQIISKHTIVESLIPLAKRDWDWDSCIKSKNYLCMHDANHVIKQAAF